MLSGMTTQPNDGLLYLQDYPRLRKWINQCVACQRLGYKPEMSNHRAADNIRKYFSELGLDAAGMCNQCAAAFKPRKSTPSDDESDGTL